ncbi:MAG: NADH-quinone oxidoreductase subunit NuoH [Chloroflexi bacterium]|nr:NADH-quinone oxidoreductase subunit NuoH [Chloroflexota bacterium]
MTDFLIDIGFSRDLAVLVAKTLGVFALAMIGLVWTIFLIWVERKVAGRFQDRLGPNRAGPFGLVQSFADAIKIILKEDIMHSGVDRWVFNIAPLLSVMAVLLLWVVIPFTPTLIGVDLSIGVLYLFAVGSLSSVAILMAGWGSNNKFALMGAFRAVAQLISYEVPMALTMLVPVVLTGSMSTQDVVFGQHVWYVFAVPLTLLIFIIASMAELGRAPFDILEAESELVAGYQVEYSGFKFGLFYVGEFLHAFTVGVVMAVLFFGGWRGPFAEDVPLLGFFYLLIKSFIGYFVVLWIRMTVPRVRVDQMLDLGWKFLVPLSLVNLLVVALVWKIIPGTDTIDSFGDALVPSLVLLVVNIVMILGVGALLREQGRRDRQRLEAKRAALEPAEAAPASAGR